MKLGTLAGGLVVLGTACAGSADDANTTERQGRSEMDISPSLLWTSNNARDAGPSAGGTTCGTSPCKDGEFCCNESCGICAPRGGTCHQRRCGNEPVVTQCLVDADCRIFSSYCDGCQCLPVGALEPDPSCHAALVACFVDPCLTKQPTCLQGVCSLDG